MRMLFFLSFILTTLCTHAQKIDSIVIPKGVSYKYCDPSLIEQTRSLVTKELSDSTVYELNDGIVFIGPVLWSRYKKIPALANIKGGNVTILFNDEKLSGKITQDPKDFKKVWDQMRKETADADLTLRKPSTKELEYYWSVISFDIEEPLFIVETSEHRYILNLSPKTMKLLWLDEVPDGY
jgi:hypothetical protein